MQITKFIAIFAKKTNYKMTEKIDIESLLVQLREFFKTQREIRFSFLHGSVLDEKRIPKDIDIAVMFTDDVEDTLDRCIALSCKLDKRIRFEKQLSFDVRPLNEAPLGFKYYAARGKLIFALNEADTFEFISLIHRMYWDWKPRVIKYISHLKVV